MKQKGIQVFMVNADSMRRKLASLGIRPKSTEKLVKDVQDEIEAREIEIPRKKKE